VKLKKEKESTKADGNLKARGLPGINTSDNRKQNNYPTVDSSQISKRDHNTLTIPQSDQSMRYSILLKFLIYLKPFRNSEYNYPSTSINLNRKTFSNQLSNHNSTSNIRKSFNQDQDQDGVQSLDEYETEVLEKIKNEDLFKDTNNYQSFKHDYLGDFIDRVIERSLFIYKNK